MLETEQPLPEIRQPLVSRILAEWKTLTQLGGPILVAQVAQMANGVIDTVMAGHYGARDLAAVGIGGSIWMPLFLLFSGVLMALQPIISNYRGAGQNSRILPITWQGIYVALIGSALMIGLLLASGPLLTLLELDEPTATISRGYLMAFAWGVPAMLVALALRGLTDGLGHTSVIMVFSVIATLINLPLNYLLIYGGLGLPELGGIGCGWATAIAQTVAALLLMAYLHFSRAYRDYPIFRRWQPPNWKGMERILRLGLPIGLTIFVEASLFCVIALFLVPLGPIVVAGHQIALNVTSLLFMLPLSLGMALTLRVSFLRGATLPNTARLLARSSLLLALSMAAIFGSLLFVFNDWIATLYTSDTGVQAVAARLLMFAALFQIADVLQVTCISALRGYEDTRVPMLIMLFSFWGVGLCLGYTLTFTDWLVPAMGAAGFWLALTAGLATASTLLLIRLFNFRPK